MDPEVPAKKRRIEATTDVVVAAFKSLESCLKSLEEKMDLNNVLLNQMVTNFQSWRQLEIPRVPSVLTTGTPSIPFMPASMSSDSSSFTLQPPMNID
jgi:hypothetical protein